MKNDTILTEYDGTCLAACFTLLAMEGVVIETRNGHVIADTKDAELRRFIRKHEKRVLELLQCKDDIGFPLVWYPCLPCPTCLSQLWWAPDSGQWRCIRCFPPKKFGYSVRGFVDAELVACMLLDEASFHWHKELDAC